MSLYNMVHGFNPAAKVILETLSLDTSDFGRFRDAYFHREDDGTITMRVHTRCGGGNREEYEDVFGIIAGHDLYLGNEDNSFDSTYCDFIFKLPENDTFRVIAEAFIEASGNATPEEKWQAVFDALRAKAQENRE